MRRICIYCPTWESGGIEAFISNIIQHMDLSNLEIDIVVDTLKNSVFTERVESLGIAIKELSGKQRAVFQNYRLLSKLMDERKYDVLHLNVFQALPMAYLLLAKQKEISLRIVHSHNTMLRKSKTYHLKMAIHRLARLLFTKNATDLWSCSSIAADFMFNKPQIKERKIQFIPNGIDLQRFQFCQEKRDILRTKCKAISIPWMKSFPTSRGSKSRQQKLQGSAVPPAKQIQTAAISTTVANAALGI